MSLLKLAMQAGPVKEWLAKYLKKLIYLKTGYHVDLLLNEVVIKDENGKTSLHMDVDVTTGSDEFYQLLEKINS